MIARPSRVHRSNVRPRAIRVAVAAAVFIALFSLEALVWPEFEAAGSPPAAEQIGTRRAAHDAASTPTITAIISPTRPGRVFRDGAIGLSVESYELQTPDLSASHGMLVALMKHLGPATLRLGGNSVDFSWWSGADGPRPAWATSVVTPADLVTLRDLLRATGWRALLGLDLGHFDPAGAAAEARAASRLLGPLLLGVAIGNEPNAYTAVTVKLRPPSYALRNYLSEVSAYVAAIRSVAPRISFYGPETSSSEWLPAVAADTRTPLVALTQHYYPTHYNVPRGLCRATPIPEPSELFSPRVITEENALLSSLVTAGEHARRETRITETNTTGSCDASGGPATSPVFASALWAFDWALRAANAGVNGIDFHGYFGQCNPEAFSPVCAATRLDEWHGVVSARPEYYGLLGARKLEGGRFVPISLSAPRSPNDLTAYATLHRGSVVTVALDNLSTQHRASVLLRVPVDKSGELESLAGPSATATTGITLGGASVSSSGALQAHAIAVPQTHKGFLVTLPPFSGAVVTLRP